MNRQQFIDWFREENFNITDKNGTEYIISNLIHKFLDVVKCDCCDNILTYTRTDDPQITRCYYCGLPYRHREYVPTVGVREVEMARRYFQLTKKIVFPCDYQILDVVDKCVGLRDYTEDEVVSWNKFLETEETC